MTDDVAVLAYAAGLIDGEGTISTNGKSLKKVQTPCVYMKVAMTDPRPILFLWEHFGGTTRSIAPRKPQHRPVYQWYAAPILASEVLRAIMPYLILKKPQAELALALRALSGGRGKRISWDNFNAGLRIVEDLKSLNKRGVDVPNTAIS